MLSEATPLKLSHDEETICHKYMCSECGEETQNTYSEPQRSRMLEKRLCFTCDFWAQKDLELSKNYPTKTIIDGRLYGPGNRTSGDFRGMSGRRFDIEYIGSSVYSGQRTTTFDLWSGGDLTEKLRAKYPDTAKFCGGAEKAQAGPVTCWNPSDGKSPAYPLPCQLKPNDRTA